MCNVLHHHHQSLSTGLVSLSPGPDDETICESYDILYHFVMDLPLHDCYFFVNVVIANTATGGNVCRIMGEVVVLVENHLTLCEGGIKDKYCLGWRCYCHLFASTSRHMVQ